eukprot:9292310-Alexandrium_andersonii.AAC.1
MRCKVAHVGGDRNGLLEGGGDPTLHGSTNTCLAGHDEALGGRQPRPHSPEKTNGSFNDVLQFVRMERLLALLADPSDQK